MFLWKTILINVQLITIVIEIYTFQRLFMLFSKNIQFRLPLDPLIFNNCSIILILNVLQITVQITLVITPFKQS